MKRCDLRGPRKRVVGILSHGQRGLILTTNEDEIWILERDESGDDLVGSKVIVEGVVSGFDRLRVDWIGSAYRPATNAGSSSLLMRLRQTYFLLIGEKVSPILHHPAPWDHILGSIVGSPHLIVL